MAQILDGKALAQKIQQRLKAQIAELQPKMGRSPGLAVLMVGDNPASAVYVRNKERSCEKIGMVSFGRHFSQCDSICFEDLASVKGRLYVQRRRSPTR